jgi:hypothetical protein
MNTLRNNNKERKEDLIWIDSQTGETFHAGVAFFNEEFGEFRLILDAPRTILYLRPHEVINGKVLYLVHAIVENNGKFSHRVEVTIGQIRALFKSNENTTAAPPF